MLARKKVTSMAMVAFGHTQWTEEDEGSDSCKGKGEGRERRHMGRMAASISVWQGEVSGRWPTGSATGETVGRMAMVER